MAASTCFVFRMLVLMETLVLFAHGFVIVLPGGERESLTEEEESRRLSDRTFHQISVHHYARHGLCRTFEGKRYFHQALKTKMCNVKLSTTENFVMDLCRVKSSMLDKWVSELFDIDGDGYISHFEKHFYRYDD